MVENNNDEKLAHNFFHSDKIDLEKYQEICSTFGITKNPTTLVSDLSYGQRKLLNMAMAFNQPHKLLMLDEPVAGVNSVTQEKIENLLLRMKDKKETILLIDHDMEFVRRMADQIIFLDAGRVLCVGTPADVLSNQAVAEAYLGV
jgi:branched-chain amino acid transport system ATP-binding protein